MQKYLMLYISTIQTMIANKQIQLHFNMNLFAIRVCVMLAAFFGCPKNSNNKKVANAANKIVPHAIVQQQQALVDAFDEDDE